MRAIALVVALTLLAVGLYRLFMDERAARQRRQSRRAPPKPSARATSPAPRKAAPVQPAKTAAKAVTAAKVETRAAAKGFPGGEDLGRDDHDADEDITIITLVPSPEIIAAMQALAAAKSTETPIPAPKPAAAPEPAEPAAISGPAAPVTASAPPAASAPAAVVAASAPAAVVAAVAPAGASAPTATLAPLLGPHRIEPLDDDDECVGDPPSAIPIVYDDDASVDEPTRVSPLILVSAAAQTHQGRRRRRNEDSMLVLEDHHLYVVADGMGGHAGGDVASKMAVEVIGDAFMRGAFVGDPYPDVPRRGGELALAIQMANKAIFDHARAHSAYQGMGTTVVSARFSPNKQRVYFGHVGDSRCYRVRGGALTQITTDHTMAAQGVTGPLANHLNRAVGVQAGVKIDLIIARPRPDDVYLLCSDGLSKMVPDDEIEGILNAHGDPDKAVHELVDQANMRGGRDNITVVLVQVKDPKGLAQYIQEKSAAAAPS